MTDIIRLTVKNFRDGLLEKKFSALEITQAFFAHIEQVDKKIGAYLSLNEEQAIRNAEHVDIMIAKGEPIPPLAGVPIAIKDNILIQGLPATAASKILENYKASYDAGVIKKLKAERATFLGKTNLDEFAMGASTENSAFQITRNPHDPTRVPGGSSGGSAAAVAAHMALGALGSDTGGSVRQPANFCGVVGLKPTYGAVSRSGLIALASSLDQIGPIAKTVEDAAMLFEAIAGPDPLDATAAEITHQPLSKLPPLKDLSRLVIGIPKEYFGEGTHKEVNSAIAEVIERFKALGFTFKNISLPHTKYALACYYIIMPAEASANLARYDGIRYGSRGEAPESHTGSPKNVLHTYLRERGMGLGSEPKRRIILGTFVLSSGYYDAYYKKAQQVRALIGNDFDEAFKDVDVILTPVSPTSAFRIGEKTSDPLAMYLSDIFTTPANLAGLPAISIPTKPLSHFPLTLDKASPSVMPIGFQLIGKHFREADILALGRHYEKTHGSKIVRS